MLSSGELVMGSYRATLGSRGDKIAAMTALQQCSAEMLHRWRGEGDRYWRQPCTCHGQTRGDAIECAWLSGLLGWGRLRRLHRGQQSVESGAAPTWPCHCETSLL